MKSSKHIKIIVLIALHLFIVNTVFAQTKLDSLKQVVQIQTGKTKFDTYVRIAQYESRTSLNSGISALHIALKYAKLLNSQILIAECYNHIGGLYHQTGDYRAALDSLNLSYSMLKKINPKYKSGIIFSLNIQANIYRHVGDYMIAKQKFEAAIALYNKKQIFEFIRIADKKNTPKEDAKEMRRCVNTWSMALNDYALLLMENNLFRQAEEAYNTALEIGNKMNNADRISGTLSNLAELERNKNNIPKAIVFFNQARKVALENDVFNYYAVINKSLSEVYLSMKKYDSSETYARTAIETSKAIQLQPILGDSYKQLSMICLSRGRYKLALKYADSAMQIMTTLDRKYNLMAIYSLYSDIYSKLNNDKLALKYLKQWKILNDSLSTSEIEEKIRSIAEIRDIQNKEKRLQFLTKENELNSILLIRQDMVIYMTITVILLLTILLTTLILFYRKKKKARILIEQQNLELVELNATKDKFFSIIAHDLKNPVAAFKNSTEIITDSLVEFSEDDKTELLQSLKESANNLYKLLENLLTWSRSQRGLINVHIEQAYISPIIKLNYDLLESAADQKNISLVNNVSEEVAINTDLNIVSTVFRNIISNAIKFTPQGGKVQAYTEASDNELTVVIEDNGVGMSKEALDKLFRLDSQYSSRGTANESGTGLGLLICKDFIERAGGKISAESELGVGTKFRIALPK